MGLGNVSERRSQPPQIGVSVVILALGGGSASKLWMPLVRRVRQPFKGLWALPGGGLRADRSLEQAAYAALESTTALHPRYLEQLHTFGDPARSRGGLPMVSIVYWALVGHDETNDFRESDNVRWFPEDALPPLAFDHRDIIGHALHRLRERIAYPDVVTRLVGDTFTLAQLHHVYEAVQGEEIDLANFRRKILASKRIEPTGEKRREGRHRPAALYRYVGASSGGPDDPDIDVAYGSNPADVTGRDAVYGGSAGFDAAVAALVPGSGGCGGGVGR